MFILRKMYDGTTLTHICEIPSNPNRFPDNTLALGTISKNFDEILWLYEGDDEFFTLLCLRKHMIKDNIKLIMPYIPHARMDRTEDGEVFTLKTFCEAINSMNFSEVIVADPHSNVSVALLDRVKVISPARYINETINDIIDKEKITTDDLTLFFPDEGAMKRYGKMFPQFRYAFGMKDRNWKTGEIKGLQVVNSDLLQSRAVLIVDDICSRGGTFFHASKAISAAGGNPIYLYVTHCEHTVFSGEMYSGKRVKKIYTTDSYMSNQEDSKIEVIYSFAEDFKSGKIF